MIEFFSSIVDEIIRKNEMEYLDQLLHFEPTNLRREFVQSKSKLLRKPRRFTRRFIDEEVEVLSRKRHLISRLLHGDTAGVDADLLLYNIKYITLPLSVGTRVLCRIVSDEEKLCYGVIDAINFDRNHCRVKITGAYWCNEGYIVGPARTDSEIIPEADIMSLDALEFTLVNPNSSNPDTLQRSSASPTRRKMGKPSSGSSVDGDKDFNLQEAQQDDDSIHQLMVKTSKLLIMKEHLTSNLTCLNFLSEREGLLYSGSQMQVFVHYAQTIHNLNEVGAKLNFLLAKLENQVQKSLSSGTAEKVVEACLSEIIPLTSTYLAAIKSERIKSVITTLLCYLTLFKPPQCLHTFSSQSQATSSIENAITAHLHKLTPESCHRKIDNIVLQLLKFVD